MSRTERTLCPACKKSLPPGLQKFAITCPHCETELVWAHSTRWAVRVFGALVVGIVLVASGIHGPALAILFVAVYVFAVVAATLVVLLWLPPRYVIKPGDVPRLFRQ